MECVRIYKALSPCVIEPHEIPVIAQCVVKETDSNQITCSKSQLVSKSKFYALSTLAAPLTCGPYNIQMVGTYDVPTQESLETGPHSQKAVYVIQTRNRDRGYGRGSLSTLDSAENQSPNLYWSPVFFPSHFLKENPKSAPWGNSRPCSFQYSLLPETQYLLPAPQLQGTALLNPHYLHAPPSAGNQEVAHPKAKVYGGGCHQVGGQSSCHAVSQLTCQCSNNRK